MGKVKKKTFFLSLKSNDTYSVLESKELLGSVGHKR